MPRYVALLRAINVGGHTVKMDRLRTLFQELDVANVETVIASGNVLFDSPSRKTGALEGAIEVHLEQALGYAVGTFVRDINALAGIVHDQPFGDFESAGQGLYIGFLKAPLTNDQTAKVLSHTTPLDEFHVESLTLYWLRHGRFSDSTVSAKSLERAINAPCTFRNVTTVRRLADKAH